MKLDLIKESEGNKKFCKVNNLECLINNILPRVIPLQTTKKY